MYNYHQSYQRAAAPNNIRRHVNTIKVEGEGVFSVQPDKAEITVGVSTQNKELQKAQAENAQLISAVKDALNRIGIRDEDIRTANFSIYPQYDYVEGKQEFRGYKVDHLLAVTVNQIENIGLVVDTAVSSGANTVSRIRFDLAEYNQHYQQALSLAVLDAYQKAETIAATLGVHLIKTPISVIEGAYNQEGPVPLETNGFVKSAVSTPIQTGTLEIASRVRAEFMYYN